jgi:molybdate transport system substrate-binding protein
MDYLASRNLLAPDTRRDLLSNRLVLIVPARQPRHVTIGPGFDLAALLGPDGRLATGDPAHVPVGIYARQALEKLGVWDAVKQRLAPANDVRNAVRYRLCDRCRGVARRNDCRHVPREQPRPHHLPLRGDARR